MCYSLKLYCIPTRSLFRKWKCTLMFDVFFSICKINIPNISILKKCNIKKETDWWLVIIIHFKYSEGTMYISELILKKFQFFYL